MPRYCYNCGSQLPDTGRFCPKCGKPTDDGSVPQPGEGPAQPEQFHNQYAYQPIPPQGQTQGWQQTQSQGGWQQPQNQGAWQQAPVGGGMAPEPRKGGGTGLIIALVLLLLASIAAVACFVWPGFLKKDAAETSPSSTTATAPETTEKASAAATVPSTQTRLTEPAVTEPLVTEPAGTESANPFLDVIEDDPCYAEYLWAHSHGVIDGNLLEGDKSLTRGEAITMLWKAFGCPTAAQNELPFPDVTVSDDCYPAVLWAFSVDLVSGSGGGTFNPGKVMTRDQAAAILCKSVNGDGTNLPNAYLDVEARRYYYSAVNWGCAAGVFERYYALRRLRVVSECCSRHTAIL